MVNLDRTPGRRLSYREACAHVAAGHEVETLRGEEQGWYSTTMLMYCWTYRVPLDSVPEVPAHAPTPQDTFAKDLDAVLAEVRALLIQKNAAYGDSALNPVRIFSKATPEEGIAVRLDDKLSRLARGEAAGEDVEVDLLGYVVMKRIARMRANGVAK